MDECLTTLTFPNHLLMVLLLLGALHIIGGCIIKVTTMICDVFMRDRQPADLKCPDAVARDSESHPESVKNLEE